MLQICTAYLMLICVAGSFSCEVDNFFEAEEKWQNSEKFVFRFLSAEPEKDRDIIRRYFPVVESKFNNKALRFVVEDIRKYVDSGSPISHSPVLDILGTNGAVIANFEGSIPSPEVLAPLFISPAKKAISLALSKNSVVFVQFVKDVSLDGKQFRVCAEKASKMGRELLNVQSHTVQVDLKNSREEFLFKNVFSDEANCDETDELFCPRPGIFVVIGAGKCIYFLDKPNHAVLFDVLNMLNRKGGKKNHEKLPRLLLAS